MSGDNKPGSTMPPTKGSSFWSRIKKYGLYATSIGGAIVIIITIYDFIHGNQKHPDLSGEWHFQFFAKHTAALANGPGENYCVSVKQSGTRNEIVEGSGNYCNESADTVPVYVNGHLVIMGSKFDDDSLLLNYDVVNHAEITSNGVIILGIHPQSDGYYRGFFYESADDMMDSVIAIRKLYIKG
jgi:hypothetical protein